MIETLRGAARRAWPRRAGGAWAAARHLGSAVSSRAAGDGARPEQRARGRTGPKGPFRETSAPTGADWLACAVVLLAMAPRLYRLDYQSFWGDEAFALRIAREPWERLLSALAASEPHPPLYYGLLHLWRAWTGESDFALRFLSTIFSVVAVAAVFALGRQLYGRRGALSAALLIAVNPFQVWYAQETRMYAMLVGLTAWSTLAFFSALSRGGRRRWLAYLAITALATFSHYHALFVVLFQNVVAALWWLRRRRGAGGWLGAQAALAALLLAWGYFAQTIFRTWSGWMPLVDFPTMLRGAFSAHTLGTSFPQQWLGQASLVLGVWAVAALAALALRRAPAAAVLALYALVPLGGAYLLGELLGRSMFHERYLIVASPAFYLLIGYGLGWQGRRLALSLAGTVVALLLALVALQNHYFDWAYHKDDLRGLARYVDGRAREGDLVVASITRQWLYQRYAQEAVPLYLIPPEAAPEEIGGHLAAAVAGYRRLWYLPYARSEVDLAGDRWLAQNGYRATERWFNTARADLIGVAPPVAPEPRSASFAGRVRLVGHSIAGAPFTPGDVAGVAAYWQAEQPIDGTLKASLRLLDGGGHALVQHDPPLGMGLHPPSRWAPGETVRDNYGVLLPVDLPPGEYRLELRLYDAANGRELPPAGDEAIAAGRLLLGPLTVGPPARPAAPAALEVARPADAQFGGVARLVGYDLPGGPWQAGDKVVLTLNWQALAPDGRDYRPVIRLGDATGAEVAKQVAANLALPVARWRPGDLVRTVVDWRLPPALAGGSYALTLGLETAEGAALPLAGGGDRHTIAKVALAARPGYAPPAPAQHATSYRLGALAQLAGYDASPTTLRAGETLRLTLHWQALAETDEGYKVFTHLISAEERVWGQHDSIPCDGSCPTFAWAQNEAIADRHSLTLQGDAPAGLYRIAVGIYDPADGRRLPVFDVAGRPLGDRVILGEVVVP